MEYHALFDHEAPRKTFYSKSADRQLRLLSNFAALPVRIQNASYVTGEHAYHGCKYAIASRVATSDRAALLLKHSKKFEENGIVGSDALEAKRMGGKGLRGLELSVAELQSWLEAAGDIQKQICSFKLHNYEDVRNALLCSGQSELIHQNNRAKHDEIWGARVEKSTGNLIGKNLLGHIWMELREQESNIGSLEAKASTTQCVMVDSGKDKCTKKRQGETHQPEQAKKICLNNACQRYAITFGEVAILHVGGQQYGKMRESGFSVQELRMIQQKVKEAGFASDMVMVSDALPEALRVEYEAATLLIHNGAALLLGRSDAAEALLCEHQNVQYDQKFWSQRQKKTMNKQARLNVVFGPQEIAHSESYEQPTVHAFSALPMLDAVRQALPRWLGAKAEGLKAEGNHYYEAKSGIGFHGDAERKIVVCLSLGSKTTLRYQWRSPGSSSSCGAPVDLIVKHGDVYVMSEKATGFDWRSRSKYRVVHAAGSKSYIQ